MENKLIQNDIDLDIKYHPEIKGLQIINGKNNFPISWLNKQGYCEYSIYLEHFEGISTAPTQAMLTGSKEHEKLEDKFKETATPSMPVNCPEKRKSFLGRCMSWMLKTASEDISTRYG